jgi:serine/threonine protein kinase
VTDPLRDYQIVSLIQARPLARVWTCRTRAGEVCVVKETELRDVSVDTLRQLSALKCPNLAAPRRVWELGGRVYEELPYVAGKPLREVAVPGVGGLGGSVLVDFRQQLTRTVRTLHAAGIAHGDIRPHNVLLVVHRPETVPSPHPGPPVSRWHFGRFGTPEGEFGLAWVVVDCTSATAAPEATLADAHSLVATISYGVTGREAPANREPGPTHSATRALSAVRLHGRDRSFAAVGYGGTLEIDSDTFVIADAAPSRTRLVDRDEALHIHRRLYSAASNVLQREHRLWIKRLIHGA